MRPSDILRSSDPCTGAIVWEGPASDAAAVDAAVGEARRAFPGWSLLSFDKRAAIAKRYRDIVTARADALARLISMETGKPLWEAQTEVASVAGKVDISIRAWQERTGNRITEQSGGRAAVRHRPHGVLGVLGPYNFPAHLPNGHIVPALLAGNTVVFKPSELTPAVALLMADLWAEAGLLDGVLSVLPGGGATGATLAGHADIDGLLFTGSAATGAALHRSFAGRPDKMLALEMGGNTPLVVWDAPDPQAAAALIVQSSFLSAGQRCTCARRLIVESGPRGDAVLEATLALTGRLIIGAPFEEPQPFMGPVISNDAAGRLLAAQQQILAAGGRALRPMTRPDQDRPWLTPALIDASGVPVADDELFGPVLQVSRAATAAEAFEQARATRFGLAAGLIGGDEALYNQFWTAMRAGIVNWNRPTTGASSAAPFGGVGASGNHRPSAWYAADYCAYPVAGVEQVLPVADLGIGFPALTAAVELNLDGLIGPTHNYAGLSLGNQASQANAGAVSNPRKAALQGLAKMRLLVGLGIPQGMLLPHERPHLPTLRAMGFSGTPEAMCAAAWQSDPALFATVMSASAMWTANAATVSPGADTADGRVHLSVANLATMPHRAIEAPFTARQLRLAFADERHFTVHDPLPAPFGDEGAANHCRLAIEPGTAGIELFVHGVARDGRFPARQTLRASQAVARRHGLDPARTLHVRQADAAIQAGAFHNDVVCVSNDALLFMHAQAFETPQEVCPALHAALPGVLIHSVPAEAVSLADAVASYLFNSQVLTLADGSMSLLAPEECTRIPAVARYLADLPQMGTPITSVRTIDIRESMRNGGGPACLRLRVPLTVEQLAAMDQQFLLDEAKISALESVVASHWPEQIAPAGLGDPALHNQAFAALDALTTCLGLGSLYAFQR